MHSASFQMDPLLHTTESRRCLFLSAEDTPQRGSTWLPEKHNHFQEMLQLFSPFLIKSFKERLRGFVCGPADGSCRCVEQHSWLPSPHEPNISIALYNCSKHISYRITSKAFTAAYTLTTHKKRTLLLP